MTKLGILLAAVWLRLISGAAAEAVPEATPVPTPEATAIVEVSPTPTPYIVDELEGDWYGYWEVFNCRGGWAQEQERRLVCCAAIDGENNMTVWDEYTDEFNPLALIRAEGSFDSLSISSARIFDDSRSWEDWTVRMKTDEYGSLLVLRGNCDDGEYGSFSFVIYLRPWDSSWPEE